MALVGQILQTGGGVVHPKSGHGVDVCEILGGVSVADRNPPKARAGSRTTVPVSQKATLKYLKLAIGLIKNTNYLTTHLCNLIARVNFEVFKPDYKNRQYA